MLAALETLLMSHMSYTTLMPAHLTLLFNCVFLYCFIIDCQMLVLYLFTICILREPKLSALVLNNVYCIALYVLSFISKHTLRKNQRNTQISRNHAILS